MALLNNINCSCTILRTIVGLADSTAHISIYIWPTQQYSIIVIIIYISFHDLHNILYVKFLILSIKFACKTNPVLKKERKKEKKAHLSCLPTRWRLNFQDPLMSKFCVNYDYFASLRLKLHVLHDELSSGVWIFVLPLKLV